MRCHDCLRCRYFNVIQSEVFNWVFNSSRNLVGARMLLEQDAVANGGGSAVRISLCFFQGNQCSAGVVGMSADVRTRQTQATKYHPAKLAG